MVMSLLSFSKGLRPQERSQGAARGLQGKAPSDCCLQREEGGGLGPRVKPAACRPPCAKAVILAVDLHIVGWARLGKLRLGTVWGNGAVRGFFFREKVPRGEWVAVLWWKLVKKSCLSSGGGREGEQGAEGVPR